MQISIVDVTGSVQQLTCVLCIHHCCCFQVKEFDKPSTLLQNPNSMFNMLVEDTGPAASAMLKQMAVAGPQDDASPRQSQSGSMGGAAPVGNSRPVSMELPR
jgi:hypothetical protein